MKVIFTIWISAVLIQEVVPSVLVRVPRNALNRQSSVHTEYEAKYEQKGRHGNESVSTVKGKQEIVHDSCGDSWNDFADKCAALIKDLIASLANAVSSQPGDATNLHLQIKNSFRHFDNTHNCTWFNRSAKALSDFDFSSLFNNITLNTVGPKGNGSDCDGDEASCGRGRGGSGPGRQRNQGPLTNLSGVDPERADSWGDGSPNSRRQAKYPHGHPREFSSGDPARGSSTRPVAGDSGQSGKPPFDSKHPLFVTPLPAAFSKSSSEANGSPDSSQDSNPSGVDPLQWSDSKPRGDALSPNSGSRPLPSSEEGDPRDPLAIRIQPPDTTSNGKSSDEDPLGESSRADVDPLASGGDPGIDVIAPSSPSGSPPAVSPKEGGDQEIGNTPRSITLIENGQAGPETSSKLNPPSGRSDSARAALPGEEFGGSPRVVSPAAGEDISGSDPASSGAPFVVSPVKSGDAGGVNPPAGEGGQGSSKSPYLVFPVKYDKQGSEGLPDSGSGDGGSGGAPAVVLPVQTGSDPATSNGFSDPSRSGSDPVNGSNNSPQMTLPGNGSEGSSNSPQTTSPVENSNPEELAAAPVQNGDPKSIFSPQAALPVIATEEGTNNSPKGGSQTGNGGGSVPSRESQPRLENGAGVSPQIILPMGQLGGITPRPESQTADSIEDPALSAPTVEDPAEHSGSLPQAKSRSRNGDEGSINSPPAGLPVEIVDEGSSAERGPRRRGGPPPAATSLEIPDNSAQSEPTSEGSSDPRVVSSVESGDEGSRISPQITLPGEKILEESNDPSQIVSSLETGDRGPGLPPLLGSTTEDGAPGSGSGAPAPPLPAETDPASGGSPQIAVPINDGDAVAPLERDDKGSGSPLSPGPGAGSGQESGNSPRLVVPVANVEPVSPQPVTSAGISDEDPRNERPWTPSPFGHETPLTTPTPETQSESPSSGAQDPLARSLLDSVLRPSSATDPGQSSTAGNVAPPAGVQSDRPGVPSKSWLKPTSVPAEDDASTSLKPTTFQTTSQDPTPPAIINNLSRPEGRPPSHTTFDSPSLPPTSPRTHQHKAKEPRREEEDEDEDCCSCESCTEEITNPKEFKETACKDLEDARRELKAIFDKIKKKLKCGRKAPRTIIPPR